MTRLRLLSWNVNGLRAVIKKDFLPWLKADSPDILGLQETRVTWDQLPSSITSLNDYEFHLHPAKRKGYSGVGLFTKTKPISVKTNLGIKKFDSEGRVLIAEYPQFQFYSIYFPNGKLSQERLDYKMAFYETLLKHFTKERKKGKNLVICGDYNTAHKEIDLAHPNENAKRSGFLPMEREWIDKLVTHGFVDTFRRYNQDPHQYSWWDVRTRARERNVGWRIDYFFVNQEFLPKVTNAFILPEIMGSDHCPVGIEIDLP
jgi:exodeoxyribonuclease-3